MLPLTDPRKQNKEARDSEKALVTSILNKTEERVETLEGKVGQLDTRVTSLEHSRDDVRRA